VQSRVRAEVTHTHMDWEKKGRQITVSWHVVVDMHRVVQVLWYACAQGLICPTDVRIRMGACLTAFGPSDLVTSHLLCRIGVLSTAAAATFLGRARSILVHFVLGYPPSSGHLRFLLLWGRCVPANSCWGRDFVLCFSARE